MKQKDLKCFYPSCKGDFCLDKCTGHGKLKWDLYHQCDVLGPVGIGWYASRQETMRIWMSWEKTCKIAGRKLKEVK